MLVQYTVVRAKLVGRDVWALAVSCEVQETNTICYSCPPVVVRVPVPPGALGVCSRAEIAHIKPLPGGFPLLRSL